MSDKTTTLQSLKNRVSRFVDERDWKQFHTPKSLSMSITAEAAELMELFMWAGNKESIKALEAKRLEVEHEVADIALLLLGLCEHYSIDVSQAIESKMALNAAK
jgi:dCTP diphosphatase